MHNICYRNTFQINIHDYRFLFQKSSVIFRNYYIASDIVCLFLVHRRNQYVLWLLIQTESDYLQFVIYNLNNSDIDLIYTSLGSDCHFDRYWIYEESTLLEFPRLQPIRYIYVNPFFRQLSLISIQSKAKEF